ncbi:MAG TPA: non-homologous end-joining DNA ligase [Methylomirabilota bacterium]|jgi:bifunctional non-homologous end joining protein LigD|nr:non-homologous end-joining DNA ligase [Methylomirabilota bacterium]
MLATLVPEPFHRPGWVYEEKYDGVRALAYRRGRRLRLYSRNLKDITAEFPEIAAALEALPGGDFGLDGEIVAFDRHGVSRFQLLQRRALGERIRPLYAIFDGLGRDGVGLLRRPLAERRRTLEAIVPPRRGVLMRARRLPPNGLTAYRLAQKRGWEGIVAKDDSSPYEPGRRSQSWLKVKCRKEAEFVIGGFTAPAGQRQHFGALLVGLFDGPALRFAGKVGTGFSGQTLADLYARMQALRAEESPFRPAPREAGATWVCPELVAQIAFAEWTADGKLRQPVFLGLRHDKKPSECTWSAREL